MSTYDKPGPHDDDPTWTAADQWDEDESDAIWRLKQDRARDAAALQSRSSSFQTGHTTDSGKVAPVVSLSAYRAKRTPR